MPATWSRKCAISQMCAIWCISQATWIPLNIFFGAVRAPYLYVKWPHPRMILIGAKTSSFSTWREAAGRGRSGAAITYCASRMRWQDIAHWNASKNGFYLYPLRSSDLVTIGHCDTPLPFTNSVTCIRYALCWRRTRACARSRTLMPLLDLPINHGVEEEVKRPSCSNI